MTHAPFAIALILGSLGFLPACESTLVKVPATANIVATGSGVVTYRAADTGQVYIYDQNADKLCYSGLVHAGQLILVDPDNSRILVDSQPVVEKTPLDHNGKFQIYMDRDLARRAPVVERRTVIEREVRE